MIESASNIITYLADNTSTPSSASTAAMSCDEYKRNLTSGLFPYEVLVFLNPVDEDIWTERDDIWNSIFKVYIGLLGSIYLMLGLFSVAMLIKKDCVRLATKTFFAVYSTIAVLGFSRALLLALDPYNLLGFISDSFRQWIIITRLLGSCGFPSLVASYTLMVFTLLKIAKANPGKQWYHKWRFVIPIVVTPYIIAIGAEVIGYFAEYPGFISIIVCEMTFALWGLTVLITYLIAGGRLMHQLRKRERNTVRMSASGMARSAEELATQNDFAAQEYQRHHKHNRRTARKIAIITYATVFMACLYSLLTFGNIIMVCLFIFKDCLAHTGVMGNSAAWLGLHISTRATEIILATIMLYSITDMSGVMKFMYRMFVAMCRCKKMEVTECSRLKHPLAEGTLNNDSYNNTCTLNQPLASGSHSHREALIGTDHNTNNCNGIITAEESPRRSRETPCEEEEEPTTTATIFQEKVDLSGMASLGDSGIQLEATDDGQENHPVVNNGNGDNNDNTASNSPRTFLLHASSKGESSSSIDSAMTQENSQSALPLQTSKQTTASIVPQTKAESTEALAQTEIHLESQDVVEEQHLNSAYVPYTSPGITMEHTIVEVEAQTTELNDKGCQTNLSGEAAPSGTSGKPVPKPRRFAPKSPRERREMQRQQKQLPQTSFSSKLKRQQTV